MPVPSYAVFDDLHYGERIAVIVRWFLLAIYLGLINYRINPDNPMLLLDGIGAAVATVNVYLTWRVWKARRVPRLLPLFAGVMDLILIADVSSGIAAVREAEFHRARRCAHGRGVRVPVQERRSGGVAELAKGGR